MESKNVIAAIALSSAVIVLYSLFFIPEQSTTKKDTLEKKLKNSFQRLDKSTIIHSMHKKFYFELYQI